MIFKVFGGKMKFEMDMEDDTCVQLFQETVLKAIGVDFIIDESDSENSEVISEPCDHSSIPLPPLKPHEVIQQIRQNSITITTNSDEGYSGFLRMKCDSCGKIKCFMPKTKLKDNFICDSCGNVTNFISLRKIRYTCSSCNSTFQYHTNDKSEDISMECYKCQSPVDLKWDDRHKMYTNL